MTTQSYSFRFRTATTDQLQEIADSFPPTSALSNVSNLIEAGGYVKTTTAKGEVYKRTKGGDITFSSNADELVAGIAASDKVKAFISSVIQRTQIDFIKANYVDKFIAVGQHDLDYIVASLESTGGTGTARVTVAAADVAAVAEFFAAWLKSVASSANSATVDAMQAAATLRFTHAGIKKAFRAALPADKLERIMERIGHFGSFIADGYPVDGEPTIGSDDIDTFQAVIRLWVQNLKDQLPQTGVDQLEGI